jgi:hypothetical protein
MVGVPKPKIFFARLVSSEVCIKGIPRLGSVMDTDTAIIFIFSVLIKQQFSSCFLVRRGAGSKNFTC